VEAPLGEAHPRLPSAARRAAAGVQVVVDNERTAKSLLERGALTKRVTIIPLNQASGGRRSWRAAGPLLRPLCARGRGVHQGAPWLHHARRAQGWGACRGLAPPAKRAGTARQLMGSCSCCCCWACAGQVPAGGAVHRGSCPEAGGRQGHPRH